MRCEACKRETPDGDTCMYCGASGQGLGVRRATVNENVPDNHARAGFKPQGEGRRVTRRDSDEPPAPPPRAARGATVGDDDFAPGPQIARAPQGSTRLDDDVAPGKAGFKPAGGGASPDRGRVRRAAGWMISFDFNESGQEYVLREGKNLLGRDRDCDFSLFFDDFVSGKHAIITYRRGKCTIMDQSSDGTFINGEEMEMHGTSPLRSGDVVRLGHSTFKVFLLSEEDIQTLVPKRREE